MRHPKTRLPSPRQLAAAAMLSLAPALSTTLAAPPTGELKPGATAPVSHNEQGNFRLPYSDELATDPPPARPACAADRDLNGAVNSTDISVFLAQWMQSIAAGTLAADFNDSGAVDSTDVQAFLTCWMNAMAMGC